jgi:putative ABC transport system substrate-binding protein
VDGLRELGWIEGRTVTIEFRWAEGRSDRAAGIAAEFVQRKVDVIITAGAALALAAKRATSTIPIVFAGAGDPVATGLVASLARPGGNVTGLSIQAPDLAGKRLELLREVLPGLRRLAIMANAGNPTDVLQKLRQRPAHSASKSSHPKSGDRRTSSPPSRRSRVARLRSTCLATRLWLPTGCG